MKKRLSIIGIAIIGAILLSFLGYCILSDSSIDGTLHQITNADTVYTDSLSAVCDAQDMTLTISKTQETTVGEDVFLEITQQTLSYTGIGTQNLRASVTETLSIDSFSAQISEIFANGIGYVTVNDACFSGSVKPEEYQKRFAPAILLDASLYGTVTGFDTGEDYRIQFAQPTDAEAWAFDQSAAFVDAKGTAYVSYDGQLTKSIYALTCHRGNASVRLTYIVEINLSTPTISLPVDTSKYAPIEYLDGPRMLERATGYLLQADHVSAKYSDSIYFQAFGDARTQEITLHTAADDSWSALVQTQTILTNDSKVGLDSQLQKTELFRDGIYQSSTNGSELIGNNEITADDMHTYCKNQLIGTVMLPQYITGARMEEIGSVLYITFSASESFAPLVSSNVCQTLYQKPELLNDMAQSNTTNTLVCYLELDKNLLLPVAAGINYDGTFTVEGVPYALRFKADQIYDVLSHTAHAEIDKAGAQ